MAKHPPDFLSVAAHEEAVYNVLVLMPVTTLVRPRDRQRMLILTRNVGKELIGNPTSRVGKVSDGTTT